MAKRIVLRVVLIIVVVAIGFFYLIRSCLSKFDERMSVGGGGSSSQAASQYLVFEKDGKGVIFSLVKFEKTISYSQKGGSTHRSVRSTYYAQSNDLATAAKNGTEKIKSGNDIKSYPVELMGAAGDKAWLFAGELMAYDPYTLSKVLDAKILEEKNPSLKGKLINERRYFEFDGETKQIRITAADGAMYELNTTTLVATVNSEESEKDKEEAEFKSLEKRIGALRTATAKAYDRLRSNNLQYQQKTLPIKQYQDSADAIKKEVALIDRQRDSLERIAQDWANTWRAKEREADRRRNAKRTGSGFSGMKLNSDTSGGQWYGLTTAEQLEKDVNRFDHRTSYNEAARNKLYTASLSMENSSWMIGEEKQALGATVYLDGGFLMDKETGLPIRLGGDFLVVHKDRIGNEGVVQLSRITTAGKLVWTINTGLKEFYDWQLKGSRLIVAGTDNKKLSSGEVNLLQIISLQTGSKVAYDFFKDKIRD
jgi:hypothetical protein